MCLWPQNCCCGGGGWIHTPGPSQAPKREDPVPRMDVDRQEDPCEDKTEPLWGQHSPAQPDKGEHQALAGEGDFFSFPCSFWSSPCARRLLQLAAPWSSQPRPQPRPRCSVPAAAAAALAPPNPTCQQILPRPDTSLDPLPVTSSSTLHLSS